MEANIEKYRHSKIETKPVSVHLRIVEQSNKIIFNLRQKRST